MKSKRGAFLNILLKNNSDKGFTLVELLIVIALLGALAVGLLAALDPFEQLKKGTDTGIRNTVSELHGATIRFYAIKNHMPWCDPSDPTTCTDPSGELASTIDAPGFWNPITQIINAGELKSDFVSLSGAQLTKIRITGISDPSPEVIVCYLPTSKSFQADPNTKFDQSGVEEASGTCKSQGGAQDCFWCIR